MCFRGWSTNSARTPSVSSAVGLGGWHFFHFLCTVRDPQRIPGRQDRCASGTEPHRPLVVRFHGTHRGVMELLVAAGNQVSFRSGRGGSGTERVCQPFSLV